MTSSKRNSAGNRPCAVAWFEIVGKDGEGLQSFFSELFGWETAEVAPGSHYGVMDAGPHGIGGGMGPSQKGLGHVTIFVEVDDLEATLQEVERLGGKRITGPITFPDKRPSAGGRGSVNFAYFADPEGHVIGLCKGIVQEWKNERRQQMTGQDYSASITANITAQEATDLINRVADWWTASFTGASGKVGDAFTVRFGETFVDFAVVELVPARRIVWRVTDCNLHFIEDKKEWKDTRVVFDISSDGAATTVTMTHPGLVPAAECYENCRTGWNFYIMQSLQKLLTENQGIPDGRRRQES